MDIQKAINILLQGVQIGQSKGAYALQDAKVISEAVEFITKPTETPKKEELKEEVVEPEVIKE